MIGIPARTITAESKESRESTAQKTGFSAHRISADLYDPRLRAIHKLLGHCASQDAPLNVISAALVKQAMDCASLGGTPVNAKAIGTLVDAD